MKVSIFEMPYDYLVRELNELYGESQKSKTLSKGMYQKLIRFGFTKSEVDGFYELNFSKLLESVNAKTIYTLTENGVQLKSERKEDIYEKVQN